MDAPFVRHHEVVTLGGVWRYVVLVGLVGACGRWGFSPAVDGAAATGDGATGDGAGSSASDAGSNGPPADAPTAVPDAPAGTQLPPPTADTYIKGIDNTTHGSDLMTYVGRYSGNGTNMFVLLHFDLTGVASCTQATLRLYQYTSVGTTAFVVRTKRLTQAWDEATATWGNAATGTAWTSGGGGTVATTTYSSQTITPGGYGFYDFDVTQMVNDWLAGNPNDGILIDPGTQPPPGNYIGFATRENSTAAWHPQLLITP